MDFLNYLTSMFGNAGGLLAGGLRTGGLDLHNWLNSLGPAPSPAMGGFPRAAAVPDTSVGFSSALSPNASVGVPAGAASAPDASSSGAASPGGGFLSSIFGGGSGGGMSPILQFPQQWLQAMAGMGQSGIAAQNAAAQQAAAYRNYLFNS